MQVLDLAWYPAWLSAQRENLPPPLIELPVFGGSILFDCVFYRLYSLVAEYVRGNRGFSIDDVIKFLYTVEAFPSGNGSNPNLAAERLLVFAILGWQSMIYQPGFNMCPLHQLAV